MVGVKRTSTLHIKLQGQTQSKPAVAQKTIEGIMPGIMSTRSANIACCNYILYKDISEFHDKGSSLSKKWLIIDIAAV